ncbi:MAG: hypothetical protein COV44_10360 [Deltaproteobacteria bacterium CG11_big_fil_rev_8_21_14_0_20_45_16]|nr:MAG: hypothetical protein COV44_10360 [Deltaproteobacteria bacterium CG11_big_fil_rev_8_21_14_0_20_45_16]
MEAIVKKKSALIEDLLSLTHNLIVEIDSGDPQPVDDKLKQRALILRELERVDRKIGTRSTTDDQRWMNQLEKVIEMDFQLKLRLELMMKDAETQLRKDRRIKTDLLEEFMLGSKGNKISSMV